MKIVSRVLALLYDTPHFSIFFFFFFLKKKHDMKFIYRWGEGGKEEKGGKNDSRKKKDTRIYREREKN